MGVTAVTQEYPIPSLPQALPLVRQQPKAFPQGIKSMDLVQGQWDTPGSIMKVTYSDGGSEKYKIAVADHANMSYKHTLVEGGIVGDKVEYADLEIKLMAGSNPVMKVITSFHTKGDLKLSEEEINAEKNKGMLISQSVANALAH